MSDCFDIKCPRCGGTDEIDIGATVYVRLCDNGTDIVEAHNGDHEWSDDSAAVCCGCGYTATVREFTEGSMAVAFAPGVSPVPECPVCAGDGSHIGDLGRRRHFRCRCCGIDFSYELPTTAAIEGKGGAP